MGGRPPVVKIYLDPTNANTLWTGALRVQYAETNVDTDDLFGNATGTAQRGQTFKASATVDVPIARIRLWLKKIGAPTDNLFVDIRSADFTITYSTSAAVLGSTLSTSYGWVYFDLAPYFTIPTNTQYSIVIRRSGAMDAVNHYAIGADLSAPSYADGQAWFLNVATWTAQTADLAFQVYDIDGNIAADMFTMRVTTGRTRAYGIADPGACEIELRNRSRQYSPLVTTALWYNLLVPGCGVRVIYYDNASNVLANRFHGQLDSLEILPVYANHSLVRLVCLDALAYVCRDFGPVFTRMTGAGEGNLESIGAYACVGAVLSEVGYTGGQALLGTPAATVDTFWTSGEDGYSAIGQLTIDEFGFFRHRGDNTLVLETRSYRDGLSSVAVWHDGSEAGGFLYTTISPYKIGARNTFNRAEARIQPRILNTEYTTVQFPEVFQMAASEVRELYLTWDNPATAPLTATAWGVRVLANDAADGSGTDRTGSITVVHTGSDRRKAVRWKVQLTNTFGSAVYITLLQVGFLSRVADGDGHTVVDENTTAKGVQHGQLVFPASPKWLGSLAQGAAWALRVKTDFAVPRDMIDITFSPESTATRDHVCARDLSEKVTVSNTQIGVNDVTYFIERIEDNLRDNFFERKFTLSKTP